MICNSLRSVACASCAARSRGVQRAMITIKAFKEIDKGHEGQQKQGTGAENAKPKQEPELAAMARPRRFADELNQLDPWINAGPLSLLSGHGPRVARGGLLGSMLDPFAMLDCIARGAELPSMLARNQRLVAIEVEDLDNKYVLRAEVPGMSKDNISVTVDPPTLGGMGAILTISGSTQTTESMDDGKEGKAKEASKGSRWSAMSFTRILTLPTDVDPSADLTAKTEHGLLIIELPKMAEAKKPATKKIPIQ